MAAEIRIGHGFDVHRFREHFPDATRMIVERVAGLPKSLIAVRKA